ncbi:AraC family transcriptional regulator [Mucilaginibacter sp. PPCGB 2223]|uniref:helix-turn-helix transcriptional regulator n=1 Tax=Mucilaginibacter sp. PPCGB 2223 TaxID=1886027 RepID=UPI000826F07C|nr:AraC family transcriptional regulator [Mucilaginibacter sp. PPCGB 2223]OCX54167.1 AraC family transcriptional regulator [Mucilaginibacter sp. PPCGB 2223]
MEINEQFPKIYLYRRIVQAKLFIDDHHPENIDLNNISGEAYFSKFHFIRLFKQAYGKTPHQYLMQVRIEHARLLLNQGMPVNKACYAVGFDSIHSFSSLFKRLVGCPPSVYQQNELKRQAEMKRVPLKFVPNCFAENNGWNKEPQFSITEV